MKSHLLLLVFVFIFCKCSRHKLDEVVIPPTGTEVGDFEAANKALVLKEYAKANSGFKNFLNRYPTSQKRASAHYHIGESLEARGDLTAALESYKQALTIYQGTNREGEAETLYRMSICYESLKRDDKMVITLDQLQRPEYPLSPERRKLEIPARLAAAYARMGYRDLSNSYFEKANKNLVLLQRMVEGRDETLWVPKTYYYMGQIAKNKKLESDEDFKIQLTSLEKSQIWLLRSAQSADNNEYSQKSAAELVTVYQNAFDYIKNLKPLKNSDEFIALIERQNRQKKMAGELGRKIEALKTLRLPPVKGRPEIVTTKLMSELADIVKMVDEIIMATEVRDQRTEQGEKSQSLKREVR